MTKAQWMLSLQTASLIWMRILLSYGLSYTRTHAHSWLCSTSSAVQCSWKQQMHELMSPDFTITNLTLPHMNYIQWGWKTNPPQTLPCVPVLFNYAENWIYVVIVVLSRWLLTGGIWANLREQGDFLLLLWFALIQDYTKTPPYSTTTFSTTTASISWLISIQFSLKT